MGTRCCELSAPHSYIWCYHLMLFLAEIETQSAQHPCSTNHENYKLTSSAWCMKVVQICTREWPPQFYQKYMGMRYPYLCICCYGTARAITSVVLHNLSKVAMHKLHQDKVMTYRYVDLCTISAQPYSYSKKIYKKNRVGVPYSKFTNGYHRYGDGGFHKLT